MSQKTELFITATVRTSHPTYWFLPDCESHVYCSAHLSFTRRRSQRVLTSGIHRRLIIRICRRFRGICHLHLQCQRIIHARNQHETGDKLCSLQVVLSQKEDLFSRLLLLNPSISFRSKDYLIIQTIPPIVFTIPTATNILHGAVSFSRGRHLCSYSTYYYHVGNSSPRIHILNR